MSYAFLKYLKIVFYCVATDSGKYVHEIDFITGQAQTVVTKLTLIKQLKYEDENLRS